MQVKAPKVTQVPVQRIDFLGHSAPAQKLEIQKKLRSTVAEKLAICIRARL
jgi:hypothetical protein